MSMNRFEQAAKERQSIADRLASEYLPDLPVDVTARVFGLAYEQGHASGWNDVENYYIEIAQIAASAYKAGQNASA